MKKIVILNIMMLVLINNYGQIITTPFNEDVLKMRVKQLDEFFARFNYENDIEGNKIDTFNVEKRKLYILSLFNQKMFKTDSLHIEETMANGLINYVCRDKAQKFLKFSDAGWYAKAECSVKYKNKKYNISIVLKPEKIKEFEYKWVICSANAEFLKLKPKKVNQGLIISPVDNELGFMELPDISTQESDNVLNYACSNFKSDELTVLFALIKSKQLQISSVNKVKYHFLQIKNWIFTVENFEREGDNAGWLISSITNANETKKKNYLHQNLNIN